MIRKWHEKSPQLTLYPMVNTVSCSFWVECPIHANEVKIIDGFGQTYILTGFSVMVLSIIEREVLKYLTII